VPFPKLGPVVVGSEDELVDEDEGSVVPVPLGPSVVLPVPEEDPEVEELPPSPPLGEGPSVLVVVVEGGLVDELPEAEAEVKPVGPVVEPLPEVLDAELVDPVAEPVADVVGSPDPDVEPEVEPEGEPEVEPVTDPDKDPVAEVKDPVADLVILVDVELTSTGSGATETPSHPLIIPPLAAKTFPSPHF
jgi:hypothetical protein